MKRIVFSSSIVPPEKKYDILIGQGLIEEISSFIEIAKYSRAFIVTDNSIGLLFIDSLKKGIDLPTSIISLSPGEKHKTIDSLKQIWTGMHQAGCDRKTLVINLGGGVIGDIGGFAASTYMRGVDFINIPTTLLSQVDASVGGKTGIDFAGIKNLVGTIDQPVAVIIDINTLQTLPRREFFSGFAEIIKHGLIKDEKYFKQVISKHPLKFTPDEMEDIIAGSIQIKADIVQSDIHENGSRKLLNFGHTIGHAIEALSIEKSSSLLHGEAISIGIMAEAKISQRSGKISVQELETVKDALIHSELPVFYSNIQCELIIKKMKSDKKNDREKINFTLLQGIGNATYNQNVSQEIIEEAINYIKQ